MTRLTKSLLIIAICFFSITTNAQWTSNTDINTLVTSSEGGDMKALGTSSGKTYVVYWNAVSAPTNYELRLQILDVDGFQLLGEEGMLVSDEIPMSTFTVIWNITTDEEDNLYIGLTGTGGGEPAYVFKLDDEGNNLWGSSGLQVGAGYSVTILPLSNGEVIVSWFPGGESVLQKYDSSGVAQWDTTATISEDGNDTVPANMFELSDGDFVLVFHSITFGINSNLFAQRFSSTEGISQWTNPTQISNYGTVFNTAYDGLLIDDNVYMGFKASPGSRFDSFLQRIDTDGTLPWGINGSDFDTNQTDYEMDTKITYQEGSQYIWATCTYTNTSQSEKGERIQKFDKETGARMLTDQAKEIYPIGSEKVHVGSISMIDNFPLLLIKEGFDNGASPTTLHALKLDEEGDFAWDEETKPLATYPANKSRIQYTRFAAEQSVAVFIENKSSGSKIYAQNFTETVLGNSGVEPKSTFSFVNPVSENWGLKSNVMMQSISIYNILGQLILFDDKISSKEVLINTKSWEPGNYILNIKTEQESISKSLLKK
ncbi:T9SS type A sorting domain-containing protein [Flavobacteriaceae bacterium]|nr:T9SS type A sorting domain-containing protein [Flavobacteriaceae bacterium]